MLLLLECPLLTSFDNSGLSEDGLGIHKWLISSIKKWSCNTFIQSQEGKTNQSNSKFIGSFVNFYYMATVLFGATMFCHYQQASLSGTGQQSAGFLAPTPLFNCLPQAALTQE